MLSSLDEGELAEIDQILLAETPIWVPLPASPQTVAYWADVDVLGYGGAAGGGKTDLAIGKALTRHEVTAIFRREGTELVGIHERLVEVLGGDKGYNGKDRLWRIPEGLPGVTGKRIEYGSVPHAGDEKKYQGRPKDLLVLDEAANFLESQARFLMGWVRTVNPNQRCQVLMTFNPPTSAEGRWIVEFFAPWLDKRHPNPAKPGEIRYFAVIDGKDIERKDGKPFHHEGELIIPESRTFIPSKVTDNPYLVGTGYMRTLQALPEPLRSQMLKGDFSAGTEDNAFQVIPSAWVQAAMDRWTERTSKQEMLGVGVDVARGGRDNTVIAKRHEGWWVDELVVHPGANTPDGPTTAGMVVAQVRDAAPVHIDVIGVGASPYDHLVDLGIHVVPINSSEATDAYDRSGVLKLANLRTVLWWRMREALDPKNDIGVSLPPDPRLYADLCTPLFKVRSGKIWIESKDEIFKRLQRSTDFADAVIMAMIGTPKRLPEDDWDSDWDDGRSGITGY